MCLCSHVSRSCYNRLENVCFVSWVNTYERVYDDDAYIMKIFQYDLLYCFLLQSLDCTHFLSCYIDPQTNLTELKSFGSPPAAAVNVVAAVMVLLAPKGKVPKDRSWKAGKNMMNKVRYFSLL